MFDICKKNKYICGGISLLLILIIVIFINKLNNTKITTTTTPSSTSITTPSSMSITTPSSTSITTPTTFNKNAINIALNYAGVNASSLRDIFFSPNNISDSINKLRQLNVLINTYYPILDVNVMNDILKNEYNIDKTMQDIINEHPQINMLTYLQLLIGGRLSFFISIIADNLTDNTLTTLANFYISNTFVPIQNNMGGTIQNIADLYYLNDYEELKDFIIYFIPPSFDKTKINNTNLDIKLITTAYPSPMYINNPLPYKVSLKQVQKELQKNTILTIINNINSQKQITSSPILDLSEQEMNNYIKIFKDNKIPLLKYVRLSLLAPLIKYYNNAQLTESSKIIIDIIDLFTPNKYFNSDYTPYLLSQEDIFYMVLDFNSI